MSEKIIEEVPKIIADHLTATRSDRGFTRLPPIPSEYGGQVAVYESSAAMGPHVWLKATAPVDLNKPDGPMLEAPIHLTADNAWMLADQLRWLVGNHYQGDARPDAVPTDDRDESDTAGQRLAAIRAEDAQW